MEINELIQNLGFPAAVAAFALWNSYKHEQFLQTTMQSILKDNTTAINELKELISEYLKKGKEGRANTDD